MSNETDKTVAAENADSPMEAAASGPAMDGAESSEWTAAQVEELKLQAAKAQEHWDRLVRISADFENYKKRAARERQEAVRFANEGILEKLVPIVDNLEMALAATNSTQTGSVDALKTGVSMIHSQLRNLMAESGLEEIDATGKPFDPNWHEAVSQQPSNDVPEGNVLQQIRKGYKLKERLIRPASVVVAKKPSA